MASEPGPFNVVVTRLFDAPVERVWHAWADPALVMRWWGPSGFTCPIARIDFRERDTSLVCMRAPEEYGGQDMFNSWTYRLIEPMERIEFIQHFADSDGRAISPVDAGLPADIPAEVRHVVTFRPIDGRTEMTVTEFGYPNEQIVAMSRMGMEQCLNKIADAVAAP